GGGGRARGKLTWAAAARWTLPAGLVAQDAFGEPGDPGGGSPSVPGRWGARRAARRWHGSAGVFGMGMAILLGDLLISWTDEMFHASGLPGEALRRGRPVLDRMRTEVFAGQYLDLLGQATGDESVAGALRVVEFKTTKYTIERPLHLGAALASALPDPAAAGGTAGSGVESRD